MFQFSAPKRAVTALINTQPITVNPGETLLQAALRQGIAFPHSCRVGGCASCKCRLLDGRVKELTETSYILSDEDFERHTILA
ncbi:MAG: 2Fe-2S iron-sulfur cluster binding domain-containing protein, partial [Burkholderiaceae bacterium]|nr:2Fe-2S iron-sulfur cluster binding domain-containing protein [Burkholderiaceae bacterium]